MSAILSLGPWLDMVGRLAWLPFGRNPLLYASDGIRNRFLGVRRDHRALHGRAPVGLLCCSVISSAAVTVRSQCKANRRLDLVAGIPPGSWIAGTPEAALAKHPAGPRILRLKCSPSALKSGTHGSTAAGVPTLPGCIDGGSAKRRETLALPRPSQPRGLRQLTLWRRYRCLGQLVFSVYSFFFLFFGS